MSISLEKQAQKAKISLEKQSIFTPPTFRVGEALDISGSMEDMYHNGSVSQIVFRTLAIANLFDDNGEMDMWAFNTHAYELPAATPENFETYVKTNIKSVGGGTRYSPTLKAIADFYFNDNKPAPEPVVSKVSFFDKLLGKKPTVTLADIDSTEEVPAFVIFITDGENDDQDLAAAEKVIKNTESKGIFWMFVGIGHNRFTFLNNLALKHDNVGFLNFQNLDMSDEALYDGVLGKKFADWVDAH